MNLREQTIDLISRVLQMDPATITELVETPPQADMGDLALPCFRFAKQERKAPPLIAQDLAAKLSSRVPYLAKVEAKGPYVNFFYDRAAYAKSVFDLAKEEDGKLLGHRTQADRANQVVLVEYSSPNIAKPFHVGHGFSTILGDAVARLFAYHGYTVKRLNHLGDYGTQFGRLIYAWLAWGDEAALEAEPIKELTRVYVKFHKVAEDQPELFDAARDHFRRLEQGEELEYKLWERFRALSLQEFSRIYDRLKISFDSYNGESFYSDKMPALVDLLRAEGLLVESQGAQVVMLDEYNLNPCIILKSDGSSIYATRDITAIFYRAKTWDYYRNVYIVGKEQTNHFKQVFAVLDKLDHPKAGHNFHVAFGRLSFGDQDFSTRAGKVILLEEFLDETVKRVSEIMDAGGFDLEGQKAEIAEAIGVAAVKFIYLRAGREHDIAFSWDEMLDFTGDTAPYLLYAYARAQSVLRKAAVSPAELAQAKVKLLTQDAEFQVLKNLSLLEEASQEAMLAYEPSILTRQIISLVRDFSRFYQSVSILRAEEEDLRLARLALCELFAQQLKLALTLLGIEVVERM
ncbi:MAG: arginine--tRNA ligase [Eubacteriales bacterium]|nr:arginine--tRNA ligase [Eubacteriales bacterium]